MHTRRLPSVLVGLCLIGAGAPTHAGERGLQQDRANLGAPQGAARTGSSTVSDDGVGGDLTTVKTGVVHGSAKIVAAGELMFPEGSLLLSLHLSSSPGQRARIEYDPWAGRVLVRAELGTAQTAGEQPGREAQVHAYEGRLPTGLSPNQLVQHLRLDESATWDHMRLDEHGAPFGTFRQRDLAKLPMTIRYPSDAPAVARVTIEVGEVTGVSKPLPGKKIGLSLRSRTSPAEGVEVRYDWTTGRTLVSGEVHRLHTDPITHKNVAPPVTVRYVGLLPERLDPEEVVSQLELDRRSGWATMRERVLVGPGGLRPVRIAQTARGARLEDLNQATSAPRAVNSPAATGSALGRFVQRLRRR